MPVKGRYIPHPRLHILTREEKLAKSREIMNKPINREKRRVRRWIEHGINITLEQYYALRHKQGDRCAICGDKPEYLQVDHNHSTGVVRELLCKRCNLGIGYFNESPAKMIAALEYLAEHS